MIEIITISSISILTIFFVTGLFYQSLCLISSLVSSTPLKPRSLMFVMISGIFIAHTLSILIYAGVYWLLIHFLGFSDLSGNIQDHFPTYLYFSATTYSSLGVGDVFPIGALRFLAGIQAINGLILITWSAAFTYFAVQKMWEAYGMEIKICKPCKKDE